MYQSPRSRRDSKAIFVDVGDAVYVWHVVHVDGMVAGGNGVEAGIVKQRRYRARAHSDTLCVTVDMAASRRFVSNRCNHETR